MLASLFSKFFPNKDVGSNYVVYWFDCMASAAGNNQFPDGERHPVLLFLKQEQNAAPNFIVATTKFMETGWRDVELRQTFLISSADKLNSLNPTLLSTYNDAVEHGFAAIIQLESYK